MTDKEGKMIHNWQCKRCTHEWQTSCMGEMMEKPEERERNHRQLKSHLCWDCFEQLEAGEIKGLEIYDLYFYLHKKIERYDDGKVLRWYKQDGMWHDVRYSGMCHPYRSDVFGPDGKIAFHGNFETGWSGELKELYEIMHEVQDAYDTVISKQRTEKRKELDDFQKTAGYRFFGSQPRPEGFVGDPPGKQRFEVLCGLDFASGKIIPPTIQLSKSGLPNEEDK